MAGYTAKVGIRLCDSYETKKVYDAVRASIEDIGGIEKFIAKDKPVMIKPNMLVPRDVSKAVTTNPEVVRAVMSLVADAGAKMVVGDSPAMGSAALVAKKSGIYDVAKSFGAEVITFSEACKAETDDKCKFKYIELAREALEAETIINIFKVKTHGAMTLTLAVKNLFGCVVGRAKTQWHLKAGRDAMAFARMLVDIYTMIKPSLNVGDGIIGMEGNGPGTGDPRKFGWVAAGAEAVSLDRVITEIVNAPVEKNYVISAAKEAGVGETRLDKIEVLGDSIRSAQAAGGTDRRPIKLPDEPTERGFAGHVLRRLFKRSFTPEPIIDHEKCTRCASCIKACPPEVMSFVPIKKDKSGNEKRVKIDRTGCIHCFCCQELCPEGVITIKSGRLAWLLVKPSEGKKGGER